RWAAYCPGQPAGWSRRRGALTGPSSRADGRSSQHLLDGAEHLFPQDGFHAGYGGPDVGVRRLVEMPADAVGHVPEPVLQAAALGGVRADGALCAVRDGPADDLPRGPVLAGDD